MTIYRTFSYYSTPIDRRTLTVIELNVYAESDADARRVARQTILTQHSCYTLDSNLEFAFSYHVPGARKPALRSVRQIRGA